MAKIFNSKAQKSIRKELRKDMPAAEQQLWMQLKSKQLDGYKFRRQTSINFFIVDFYCPEARLVIEVDGDSHFFPNAVEYDKKRQQHLEALHLNVLRFTNMEIYENMEDVLQAIRTFLIQSEPPVVPLGKGDAR